MSGVRQNDLFGSLNLKPKTTENKQQLNQNLNSAIKRVEDSRLKYQPSVVLPQYSILRQKIILIENLVKQGRLQEKPYLQLIQDKDKLWKVVKNIKQSGWMDWDSETDSLNPMTAKLAGVSLHDSIDDISYYIPMTHCDTQRNILPGQLDYETFKEVAGELFIDPNVLKSTHNAVYDNRVVKNNLGIVVVGQGWDTLLYMNAIDENHKNNKLKPLYREFIDPDDEGDTFEVLFDGITFQFVPIHVGYIYAAGDSYKTNRVRNWQMKELSKPEYRRMLQHYNEVEVKQLEIVSEMEETGIEIDENLAKELSVEYNELLGQIKSRLDLFVANQFGLKNMNYGSADQMATLIYDKMKCDSVDKKKPRGTGAEIIDKLVEKNPNNKILKDIVLYRGTTKLLDTYIDNIPNLRAERDNRVHPRWHPHGARTGRYSSTEPNGQNIPSHFNKETGKDDSRVRWMFVPKQGYVFISSDFSQIEPRILAYRSDDFFMLNAYNTGQDLYSLMASGVYNTSYENCLEASGPEAKRRRDSMKAVLLGLMYGRQSASIGQQLSMSPKEAERFVEQFFETYPSIKAYIEETVRMGTLLGYVTTIYDRRRRLPDLNHAVDFIRQEAQRQAVNATIQGSSADITKKAMWNIFRDEWLRKNDCKMVLTIHDEVIMEVPEDRYMEAGQHMRDCMVQGAELLLTKLPVKCDVELFRTAWNKNGEKLKLA